MPTRCPNCACSECDNHSTCEMCLSCFNGKEDGFCTDGCRDYIIDGIKVNE